MITCFIVNIGGKNFGELAAICQIRQTSLPPKFFTIRTVVKAKFQAHFVKNNNVIYERAKFNRWCQQEGEMVDKFVTALHTLAEHCSYGALKEEMICNRLVVGVHDASLSLKLQMDPNLTLKTAVTAASQNEIVRKQQSIVRPADQPPNIDYIISKKQLPQPTKSKTCTRCWRSPPHSCQDCSAREASATNVPRRVTIPQCVVQLDQYGGSSVKSNKGGR